MSQSLIGGEVSASSVKNAMRENQRVTARVEKRFVGIAVVDLCVSASLWEGNTGDGIAAVDPCVSASLWEGNTGDGIAVVDLCVSAPLWEGNTGDGIAAVDPCVSASLWEGNTGDGIAAVDPCVSASLWEGVMSDMIPRRVMNCHILSPYAASSGARLSFAERGTMKTMSEHFELKSLTTSALPLVSTINVTCVTPYVEPRSATRWGFSVRLRLQRC